MSICAFGSCVPLTFSSSIVSNSDPLFPLSPQSMETSTTSLLNIVTSWWISTSSPPLSCWDMRQAHSGTLHCASLQGFVLSAVWAWVMGDVALLPRPASAGAGWVCGTGGQMFRGILPQTRPEASRMPASLGEFPPLYFASLAAPCKPHPDLGSAPTPSLPE